MVMRTDGEWTVRNIIVDLNLLSSFRVLGLYASVWICIYAYLGLAFMSDIGSWEKKTV
jgi:hypothetical protein